MKWVERAKHIEIQPWTRQTFDNLFDNHALVTRYYRVVTIPDRNHTGLDRLGSAAHEILKIIESPLPYGQSRSESCFV